MGQEILVAFLCIGALLYLGRRFRKEFSQKSGCGGCGTCASVKNWEKMLPPQTQSRSK